MKWIAKRILLTSREYMHEALAQIIFPFIDEIKRYNYISGWYCSRKTDNDGSKPSIRIYLNIYDEHESKILTILNTMLDKNRKKVGWTGKYDTPNPTCPDPSRTNLKKIEYGCEIAVNLLKKYPDPKMLNNANFYSDLVNRIKSLNTQIDNKAIHFIANNLNINELLIYNLLKSNNIKLGQNNKTS